MKNVCSALVALLAIISPVLAVDKEKAFKAGRAETYPARAEQGKVTVAVQPFTSPDEIRQAFGKAELHRYGVLPVLLVIDNNGTKALKVDLLAEYVTAGGKHLESTPAEEIMYLNGVKRTDQPPKVQLPIPTRKPKNKLEAWEVTGRAFNVKLIPPGESVSGFVYFQTVRESGAKIYLNGFSEAGGKDLFYFEIPLPGAQ
jgi:hypothetical protein